MTVLVDRDADAKSRRSEFAQATGTGSSFANQRAKKQTQNVAASFGTEVCLGLQFVLNMMTSTFTATILLIFGLAFATLMVLAIAVVLTCGLACYA